MQRKWQILLAVFSLAGFVGFATLLTYFYGLFKGPLFEQTVASVQAHDKVVEALGLPIEASFFVSGNYFFDSIYLQYDIRGSRDSGTVFAMAEKGENGQWLIDVLAVQPEQADDMIWVTEREETSQTEGKSSGGCTVPEDFHNQEDDG